MEIEQGRVVAYLTWINNDWNCGQTLQAFALDYALTKKSGFVAFGLDYKYVTYNPKYLNHMDFELYRRLRAIKRGYFFELIKFDNFVQRRMHVEGPFFRKTDIQEFIEKMKVDGVIIGGDQVWNPQSGPIPDVMLAYFDIERSIKKIAYSPSMCSKEDKEIYIDELRKIGGVISDFDYVGVREYSAQELLNRYTDASISVNLDTVFLLTKEEWNIETKDYCTLNYNMQTYIFVCIYGEILPGVVEQVCLVKEKLGIEKVVYYGKDCRIRCPKQWKRVRHIGPGEFVQLIFCAQYVITDSFHATAFSIIGNVRFNVFASRRSEFKSNYDRVTDMLKRFNLSKKQINDTSTLNMEELDYEYVLVEIERNYNAFLKMLNEKLS